MKNAVIFFVGPYMLLAAMSAFFLYRICGRFTEQKESRWAKILLFGIFWLTSTMVVWIGDNNFALMLPFYLAAFYLATKGNRLGRLTVGGIFFCLITALCSITDSYLLPMVGYAVSRALRPVAFGLLYLLFYRKIQEQPVRLPNRLWRLCAGLTLLPFVTLSVLILPTYWMEDYSRANDLSMLQGAFILPLTILVSVMILFSILILDDYERKSQAATLSQMREFYYQNLQKEQRQIRTLRHDLRNHLNTVRGLLKEGQGERAEKYLGELAESPALQKSRRVCENEIVNVVLASKAEEMEEKGLHLDLKISLPSQLPFADTDLCALLGNALDNAMEGAEKSQDKKIFLRCKEEYGMFMLLLRNSWAGDQEPDLSTTKEDNSLHGFGLPGMREITSRYGGVLEAGPKENFFELVVNIPLN